MKKVNIEYGKKVNIHSPATIANIVCGFDVLGMAINQPYDIMTLSVSEMPGVRILHEDNFNLPAIPEKNVAGISLLEMMKELPADIGFDLVIKKQIKPGSGLGSSAASSAGAVCAANQLLGNVFSKNEMVRFAMMGEKLASGVKHADNIAPCLYGGITIIRSVFPLDIVSLLPPPLFVAIVHPQIEVKTSDSREILRKELLLKDAIRQWGNIAGLVAGFLQQDYELISRSLDDVLIEPVRSMLIPGFDEVKKKCIEAGALGGGISGSGPSVFMLCRERSTALEVEKIMQEVYDRTGLNYNTYVTDINIEGVKIME